MSGLFDPIIIRYDGRDASNHEIDLGLLGESLKGGSRLLAVAGHLILTGTYVSRAPAMSVRVLASSVETKCFEVHTQLVYAVPMLPLLSHAGEKAAKKAIEAAVNFMLARLSNRQSEADKALAVAMAAIEANREISGKSLDLVRQALDKAGGDQRPAARSFAAPVGESISTAVVGRDETAFVVDAEARKAIEYQEPVDIGPAKTYTVAISELDIQTGACKVMIHGDSNSNERYAGEITDPVVRNPRSPYSAALDSQGWIKVIGKSHIRNGELEKLTISDTQL